MPHVVKHWLHGECEFNVKVDTEHECLWCVHNYTCSHDMEKLCRNFVFGTSEHKGCHCCINHYTRWDNKQPIPCFSCKLYERRQATSTHCEVWCEPKPGAGCWRIGITLSGYQDSGAIGQYIHKHPGELPFTDHDGHPRIEFVPITSIEYDYMVAWIEASGSDQIIFNKQWFEEHTS